ncbi:MAG: hypothetical protein V9G14_02090 [Cypionkella sp.]
MFGLALGHVMLTESHASVGMGYAGGLIHALECRSAVKGCKIVAAKGRAGGVGGIKFN